MPALDPVPHRGCLLVCEHKRTAGTSMSRTIGPVLPLSRGSDGRPRQGQQSSALWRRIAFQNRADRRTSTYCIRLPVLPLQPESFLQLTVALMGSRAADVSRHCLFCCTSPQRDRFMTSSLGISSCSDNFTKASWTTSSAHSLHRLTRSCNGIVSWWLTNGTTPIAKKRILVGQGHGK